jgi:hypothetical protein
MARSPDWCARLDAILATLGGRRRSRLGWAEIGALFGCCERDGIRVLHKFGAVERGNALMLERASLLPQLEAIAAGASYPAFRGRREGVARYLAEAAPKRPSGSFAPGGVPGVSRAAAGGAAFTLAPGALICWPSWPRSARRRCQPRRIFSWDRARTVSRPSCLRAYAGPLDLLLDKVRRQNIASKHTVGYQPSKSMQTDGYQPFIACG